MLKTVLTGSHKLIYLPIQGHTLTMTCCDTPRHTLTQPLPLFCTPNFIFSPSEKQVRSGLTVPLNLTSRSIHQCEEHRAKGLSIYLTGPGHIEDGKRWRERILAGSKQVMGMRTKSRGNGERNSGALYRR